MAQTKGSVPRKAARQAQPAKPTEPIPDAQAPDAPRVAEAPSRARQRVLRRNVVVDGVVYGPSHPEHVVTDEVAARISNPAAWS